MAKPKVQLTSRVQIDGLSNGKWRLALAIRPGGPKTDYSGDYYTLDALLLDMAKRIRSYKMLFDCLEPKPKLDP